MHQYSKTNEMQCLYPIYYELTVSTCFEHYLLIFRRRRTDNNWYIAYMLCLLAATGVRVELQPDCCSCSAFLKMSK
jgi:recombinational DNA repair protein (RecF pathway)